MNSVLTIVLHFIIRRCRGHERRPRNTSEMSWPGRTWYQDDAGPVLSAPALAGSHRCAVAIVGGGLAGLSTAFSLVERGVNEVCVLESLQPGHGASGRNGGFVFAGYSLANEALVRQAGVDQARLMHGWTRAAVALIARRAEALAIGRQVDCQVNRAGVLLADWFGDDRALEAQAERLDQVLGFRLQLVDRADVRQRVRSERYGCGLHEPGSFHFQPLRYLNGLVRALGSNGATVFGDSPVRRIERTASGWKLCLDGGQVLADEVVLATGGYDRRLWPAVQRALQPVATYIAVTRPLGSELAQLLPAPLAVYDTRFAFDYYRPLPDQRLLWGGRISMAARSPDAIRRLLRRDMVRVFPSLRGVRLDYAWGGWMSYALHQMPLLGQTREGLWHALAFGGHGMAPTTLAGEVLAEALNGAPERLRVFSAWPTRWAGGMLGRSGTQLLYWSLQARDALRTVSRKFLTSA